MPTNMLFDKRGLTRPADTGDSRSTTASGLEEIGSALLSDRVGPVTTIIGMLAYRSSFDPHKCRGEVPVNVSLFSRGVFWRAVEAMRDAFKAGLGIGNLVAVASEGQQLGEVMVPSGKIGFATVSQIVVCGALLKAGIPVDAKFGGILQIRNHEALRFVDLIKYNGSSLDPSEVFVAGKMTTASKVIKEGNGKILASLWEIPALARPKAETIIEELQIVGMQGLITLGRTGQPVCEPPVAMSKVGMVLADGLNPVAAAIEAGIEVTNHAMSGVIDFEKLELLWDCQSVRK